MGTGFDGLTPIKRSTYGGFKDSDSGPTWDRSYIHTYIYIYITSSTAQGGGGSFKDRTL